MKVGFDGFNATFCAVANEFDVTDGLNEFILLARLVINCGVLLLSKFRLLIRAAPCLSVRVSPLSPPSCVYFYRSLFERVTGAFTVEATDWSTEC